MLMGERVGMGMMVMQVERKRMGGWRWRQRRYGNSFGGAGFSGGWMRRWMRWVRLRAADDGWSERS
jgi:hypothetical protein